MKIDFFHLVLVKFWYFWLILFAGFMIKLLFRMYKPAIKGAVGETIIGVTSSLGLGNDYRILKDIVIPAYDGTTQIDQIVISKYGIFVLEIKNYKGWIFGQERDAKWTQSFVSQKHTFQNPLLQNYKHIKSLQELTGLSQDKFRSLIVFSGEVTFKTPMPSNVTKGIDYINYIKSFRDVILTENEIGRFIHTVSENRLSNTDHRKYIRERFKNV